MSEDEKIKIAIMREFGANASYADVVGRNMSTHILKKSGESLPQIPYKIDRAAKTIKIFLNLYLMPAELVEYKGFVYLNPDVAT